MNQILDFTETKGLVSCTDYSGTINNSEAVSYTHLDVYKRQVFNQTLPANSGSYSRARIRKELGNPPGKVNDPLGDQLNWTQVLENIEKVSALWIVSADNDSVSYTHLDVYKRQKIWSLTFRRNWICQNGSLKINEKPSSKQVLQLANKP